MSAHELPSPPARGLSLIELMIAMVIGLVVMGAVLAAYLGSGVSSQHSQAMVQMVEDATVALNILRHHVAQAGYSRPASVAAGRIVPLYSGPALFGCSSSFANLSADIAALTCGGGSNHALAVAYEADASNSLMGGSPGSPLDCIGNGLSPQGSDPPGRYHLSYSRFYVASSASSNNALYCRGNSAASSGGQALVENIQQLDIRYGLAAPDGRQVQRYLSAAQLTAAGGRFTDVVSVRICVVVASALPVLDAAVPYQGCDPFATLTTPLAADRHLYRAFTSTVLLQNKVL